MKFHTHTHTHTHTRARAIYIYIYIYLLTYLLTYSMEQSPSWEANWFLASQEIPRIFGTRRFITVLTSAHHLSLLWANSIQSPQPPPTSWRSILILSSHLCLGLSNGSFPQVSPPEPCTPLSPAPSAPHAPPISFFSILPPAQYSVRSTDH